MGEPQRTPPDQSLVWHEIQSERLRRHAATSLLGFTRFMNPNFRINWHHRVICGVLDRFVRREITRVMIFVEPQCGKSEIVSRHLPAYVFGQDPDHRWITAAYGDTFASEFNLDVQRIMESERYRGLFPDSRIAEFGERGWVRNTSRFDIVGRTGRYHSVGVGGQLTGKTGYTLSIDDPVKNEKEVRSPAYREDQWKWFKMAARTRLKKDRMGRQPGILLTMTRWHHDDLAARILAEIKAHPELPPWTVLNFPAEKEDDANPLDPRKIGEPLWPENRSAQDYLELKVDPRTWNALYQQRPSTAEGNIFKREWWRYYTKLPDRFDKVVQSWDLTFDETEKGSFVVGQVWGKLGPNFYLIGQFRRRVGFTEQIDAVLRTTRDYPEARAKLVEKKANGAALINVLKKSVSGLLPVEVSGSKENRAEAVAPLVRAGNVYLPDPQLHGWVDDFIEEYAEFPLGKNDDQVDAGSQALSFLDGGVRTDIAPVSLVQMSKWNI